VLDGSVRKTQLFNLKDNSGEFLQEHGQAQSLHRLCSPERGRPDP
jgi:hypothetical protein